MRLNSCVSPQLPNTPFTLAECQPSGEAAFDSRGVDRFESSSAVSGLSSVGALGDGAVTPKKVAVFYRWGDSKDIAPLIAAGGLTPDNAQPFIDNSANLKGDGIYLAETPVTAQMYGDSVAEVWVDQSLIDDGHFERFGGIIGGDWWLGQIDDLLEANGIDLSKLNDPAYIEQASVKEAFKSMGVHYRPFEGAQLPRGEMEKLIRCSEPEKRGLFQNILAERTYFWTQGEDGALSATEYTASGYEIGPLEPKYCTVENQAAFKAYPGATAGSVPVSGNYDNFQPYGFENDLEALSHKGFLHRAWEAYKDFKIFIMSCFKGSAA